MLQQPLKRSLLQEDLVLSSTFVGFPLVDIEFVEDPMKLLLAHLFNRVFAMIAYVVKRRLLKLLLVFRQYDLELIRDISPLMQCRQKLCIECRLVFLLVHTIQFQIVADDAFCFRVEVVGFKVVAQGLCRLGESAKVVVFLKCSDDIRLAHLPQIGGR